LERRIFQWRKKTASNVEHCIFEKWKPMISISDPLYSKVKSVLPIDLCTPWGIWHRRWSVSSRRRLSNWHNSYSICQASHGVSWISVHWNCRRRLRVYRKTVLRKIIDHLDDLDYPKLEFID
jgi:hypothetical protein